jgi:hypothetical protein
MLTTSAMLIGVTIVAVAVAVAVACAKVLDEKAISASAVKANLVPVFIFGFF